MKKTILIATMLGAAFAAGMLTTAVIVTANTPKGYHTCIQTIEKNEGEGFCAVYNTPYDGWVGIYDSDDNS